MNQDSKNLANKQKLKKFLTISVLLAVTTLITVSSSGIAYADVISPVKQHAFGISNENITCKAHLFKAIRTADSVPVCVKPASVEKLLDLGWIKPLDLNAQKALDNKIKREPIGEVKTVTAVADYLDTGISKPSASITQYNYVFELCAFDKTIRAPEVIISSDSDAKTVKLADRINANTCQKSAVKIKAAQANSISGKLVNDGQVSQKINSLEIKVTELTTQLEEQRKMLSSNVTDAVATSVGKKITELRKELINTKDELNRYLFTLYVKPTQRPSDLNALTTFSGEPVMGATVTKVKVSKTDSDSAQLPINALNYVTVFQICAKDSPIRDPAVIVSSAIDTKTVRLANKIPANTCQMSSAVIPAENPASIQVLLKTTDAKSKAVEDTEKKVKNLQTRINNEKINLDNLISSQPRPADYDAKFTEISNKIIQLRQELNESKTKLYVLLRTS